MCIDSYFNSAMEKVTVESLLMWTILAAVVGIFTFFLWHKGKISAVSAVLIPSLVYYLCFTLTITIIERNVRGQSRYILEPLWSYKAILDGRTDLITENFWNVILFVPIGCMLAGISRKHQWTAIFWGFLLSIFIEVFQLLAHRGLFEFDDIFHNTAGTVVGMILCMLICRIVETSRNSD